MDKAQAIYNLGIYLQTGNISPGFKSSLKYCLRLLAESTPPDRYKKVIRSEDCPVYLKSQGKTWSPYITPDQYPCERCPLDCKERKQKRLDSKLRKKIAKSQYEHARQGANLLYEMLHRFNPEPDERYELWTRRWSDWETVGNIIQKVYLIQADQLLALLEPKGKPPLLSNDSDICKCGHIMHEHEAIYGHVCYVYGCNCEGFESE